MTLPTVGPGLTIDSEGKLALNIVGGTANHTGAWPSTCSPDLNPLQITSDGTLNGPIDRQGIIGPDLSFTIKTFDPGDQTVTDYTDPVLNIDVGRNEERHQIYQLGWSNTVDPCDRLLVINDIDFRFDLQLPMANLSTIYGTEGRWRLRLNIGTTPFLEPGPVIWSNMVPAITARPDAATPYTGDSNPRLTSVGAYRRVVFECPPLPAGPDYNPPRSRPPRPKPPPLPPVGPIPYEDPTFTYRYIRVGLHNDLTPNTPDDVYYTGWSDSTARLYGVLISVAAIGMTG